MDRACEEEDKLRAFIAARWPKASRLFRPLINITCTIWHPYNGDILLSIEVVTQKCWIRLKYGQSTIDIVTNVRIISQDYNSPTDILWTQVAQGLDQLEAGVNEFIVRNWNCMPRMYWGRIFSNNHCGGLKWQFRLFSNDSMIVPRRFIYRYAKCIAVKRSGLPPPIMEAICHALEAYAVDF